MEGAENVQYRLDGHVVVKQPERRDFAELLPNGHFANGAIAD
jgi:hypothetical protein